MDWLGKDKTVDYRSLYLYFLFLWVLWIYKSWQIIIIIFIFDKNQLTELFCFYILDGIISLIKKAGI